MAWGAKQFDMKYERKFRCFAVSDNTNSFGLYQAMLINTVGAVYSVCANSLNVPKVGDDLWVDITYDKSGHFLGYDFTAKGFEIPERRANAPDNVIKEIFKQ